jgi:hypothetical protein
LKGEKLDTACERLTADTSVVSGARTIGVSWATVHRSAAVTQMRDESG